MTAFCVCGHPALFHFGGGRCHRSRECGCSYLEESNSSAAQLPGIDPAGYGTPRRLSTTAVAGVEGAKVSRWAALFKKARREP